MAEGIEVRFFGKLTYYAISIYVLFVLGLLIVCIKRYKSLTHKRRLSSKKEKSDREAQADREKMGLVHGRPKDEKRDDEAVRQRRNKDDRVARFSDETWGSSVQSNKTANGQLLDSDTRDFKDSYSKPKTLSCNTNHADEETSQKECSKTTNAEVMTIEQNISTPESSLIFATSAKDSNKNAIENQLKCITSNSQEMGWKGSSDESNENACVSPLSHANVEQICSGGENTTGFVYYFQENEQEVRENCYSIQCNNVEKNVSDNVCETTGKHDPLNDFASKSSSVIVASVLQEMTARHLETAKYHIQRRDHSVMSPNVDKDVVYDYCRENKLSQRIKENIMEYADNLATEIIYGYSEDNNSPLSASNGYCHSVEEEKAMHRVSTMGFCQAIVDDVCKGAPKAARELEVFCDQIAKLTMIDAFDEYAKLPADQKKSKSNDHKRATLRVDAQRKKIFHSSEDIYCDNVEKTESNEVHKFSDDVGNDILNHAIRDVRCKYGMDNEKNSSMTNGINQTINEPDIVINSLEEDNQRFIGDSQIRNDSMSNLDADDEDDGGEDSCYSDESDQEAGHQPVILRNKNTLKLKLHSDRPLSGYAEQLFQFLADDDDGLDMFESDEEFDAVLGKLEEKYKDDEGLYTKIQKRRKLSESRRKSECLIEPPKVTGKRILSLERLSDDDWREGLTSTMSESSLLSYTDTDDALKGVLSDDLPMSPISGRFDLKKTVVVDAGCGVLKAGLAGEVAPSQILPSVVGVPRRFSQDVSKMTRGYYVGDEAITHAGMLQLDHPIKKEASNWSDVYSLLEYVLEDALQVNVREHPILLTEIGLRSKKHREKLTEIMFERFGCQAFFLANQGPLSLYSVGLTSGLCLNSGFCTTQAIPVYEGHSLPYCTRQLDIGGQQITNYLGRQLLSERSLAFSSSSEKFLLADMMERYCYVPLDLKSERERLKKNYDDVRKFYELPDGQLIDLDVERFQSSEILFDPEIIGLEQNPLHQMVHDSIAAADQDLKRTMMSNTVVTGGTTLLQGFTQRLQSELTTLQDHSGEIKLKNAHNPVTATWTGASVISSMSSFSQQCITTDQYADTGSHVVHMRCF